MDFNVEVDMPVLLTQELPVPQDVIEQVTKEMDVANDPPDGLIVHVNVASGDSTRVVDIWETREQFERFAESRLGPAIGKVLAERGIEPFEPPTPMFEDANDLVRGR